MRRFKTLFTALFLVTTLSAQNYVEDPKDVCPLLPGHTIPEVTVKTPEGESFNLLEHIMKQRTILIFFRGSWCSYCSQHFADLKAIEKDLTDLGYQVLAVSMDSPETLRKTEYSGNIIMLSDSEADAAAAFGLAFKVGDKQYKKYLDYGIDLEAASGEEHHVLPVPAAYIINTSGLIEFGYINSDYKIRLDPVVLKAAAASMLDN